MTFKKLFPGHIHINPTANGMIIVRVGCAELAFNTIEEVTGALLAYANDPEGMEKEYNKSMHGECQA